MSKKSILSILVAIIIVVALFTRLFPHVPNAVPLAGIALLGAAYFSKRALVVALIVALYYVGDLVLNNTVLRTYYPDVEGTVWYADYMLGVTAAIVLMVVFGRFVMRRISFLRVLGGAFGASLIFYVVTNFQVWAMGTMYTKSLGGLVECYVAAIPFFRTALMTNVAFSLVAFAIVEYVAHQQSTKTAAAVAE